MVERKYKLSKKQHDDIQHHLLQVVGLDGCCGLNFDRAGSGYVMTVRFKDDFSAEKADMMGYLSELV